MQTFIQGIGLAALLLVAGCAADGSGTARPEPRPLGRDLPVYQPPREAPRSGAGTLDTGEPSGPLTLRQALALALLNSPELAAFSWDVRAGEARVLQAGLLPNPEAEIEIGEAAGSGERRRFDGAESSIVLSQLVELGGKRAKRSRLAELEWDLSAWDYESKRLDVFAGTAGAFVEVLAAQERLALAEDSHRLAERILGVVLDRIAAGAVPALEESKARVTYSSARFDLARAKRDLEASRLSLAAFWGGTAPVFTLAAGDFETIGWIPPLEALLQRIAANPDLARWDTEMEMRRAALELEESKRTLDLTVSAGLQRFEETDDTAFILGLAIPFPLFDRNQGGVLEAGHGLARAGEERRAAWVRAGTALRRAHQALSIARLEAVTFKNEVLPAAQRAFEAAREGYEQGKFGYLEVLDAQRTLFEAKGRYIEALAAYHTGAAEGERLIGQGFDSLKNPDSGPEETNHED